MSTEKNEIHPALANVTDKVESLINSWETQAEAWGQENQTRNPDLLTHHPQDSDFEKLEDFMLERVGAFADKHFDTGLKVANTVANSIVTVLPKKLILRTIKTLAKEFTELHPEEATRLNTATKITYHEMPGMPTKVGDFIQAIMLAIQETVTETLQD